MVVTGFWAVVCKSFHLVIFFLFDNCVMPSIFNPSHKFLSVRNLVFWNLITPLLWYFLCLYYRDILIIVAQFFVHLLNFVILDSSTYVTKREWEQILRRYLPSHSIQVKYILFLKNQLSNHFIHLSCSLLFYRMWHSLLP